MIITLPENLIYFSVLEILFGLFLMAFAGLQMKYKFQIPMDSRYQRKSLLIACLVIFFVVLAIQLHMELPQYQGYVRIIYGSIGFAALLEMTKVLLDRTSKRPAKTSISLRHAGLIIMGIAFIYVGVSTLLHQISG